MSLAPLHIASIQPYKPGKPMAALERELGLTSTIKLASNENPVGPSPKVLRALRASLAEINRYPDGSAFELTRALSARLVVPPEAILLGNGSNEVIEIAVRTFLRPGEEVVSAAGAFVVYQLATQAAGGANVVVPMRAHTHDLTAMAAAVTPRTRFVFVANPNNPFVIGTGESVETPMVSQMDDLTSSRAFGVAGAAAMREAGMGHDDVDHMMVYDAFAHLPLYGLEDLGFCKRGEAGAFIWDGLTRPGGTLPLNTNGGGLSYMHSGMYGMYALQESVRQLRGTAPAQVRGAEISLCLGVGGMFAASGCVVMSNVGP